MCHVNHDSPRLLHATTHFKKIEDKNQRWLCRRLKFVVMIRGSAFECWAYTWFVKIDRKIMDSKKWNKQGKGKNMPAENSKVNRRSETCVVTYEDPRLTGKTLASGLPNGILRQLVPQTGFSCSYDLTKHKPAEKSIGQPSFGESQRGRPLGPKDEGFGGKPRFGRQNTS